MKSWAALASCKLCISCYALVVIGAGAAATAVLLFVLLLLPAYSWNTCNIHTLANAFVALSLSLFLLDKIAYDE